MLGLSIQYSYKAININVIKYSSTFLSKYTRIPFFNFRYLKYTDELIKLMQTFSDTVIVCSGVIWAATTGFAFLTTSIAMTKNTKISWLHLSVGYYTTD